MCSNHILWQGQPVVITSQTPPALRQTAAKPGVTDVGAQLPALKEQTEPLLPSGKHSSPVTGYVPAGVLGKKDDIEQVREGLPGSVRSAYKCLGEREAAGCNV